MQHYLKHREQHQGVEMLVTTSESAESAWAERQAFYTFHSSSEVGVPCVLLHISHLFMRARARLRVLERHFSGMYSWP